MDGDIGREVVGISLRQATPSNVAGIVDHDVDAPEFIKRSVDQCLPAFDPCTSLVSGIAVPPASTIFPADTASRFKDQLRHPLSSRRDH